MHKKSVHFKIPQKPLEPLGSCYPVYLKKSHKEHTLKIQKSINTIQLGTSFISSVKRKDSGLHHVCSDNVVHSVKHWAVHWDHKFYKRFYKICWWKRTALERDFQSALSQQLPNFLTITFFKKKIFLCYPWQRNGRRFQLLGIHCNISGDEREQQVHPKANSGVHIQTMDIKNDATFQGCHRPQETMPFMTFSKDRF